MAGGFGYERGHVDVSVARAERRLLPAVRAADGLIVAHGFSCREQIRQLTGRRALHVAEVLAPAPPTALPRRRRWLVTALLGLAAVLLRSRSRPRRRGPRGGARRRGRPRRGRWRRRALGACAGASRCRARRRGRR